MDFFIKRLTAEYEKSYMEFVLSKKESLMYYSVQFRDFLADLLNDEYETIIAVDGKNQVIGCLPIFYRQDKEGRIVANSLPYYGGHGGPIAHNDSVMQALLEEYVYAINGKNCVASTIIGSPLEHYDQLYKDIVKPDYIDERIELMTYFPYESELPIPDALMSKYHHMERRCIRKAIKNEVSVRINNSKEAMDFLFGVHTENMLAIGGLPKIHRCFELIQEHFKAGEDYNIYIAEKDGKNIAALLLFYFNGTVEYYTPAIVEEYRTIQPLTLVIFVAMQDAMKKGFEKWNWGGTGLSQNSLYDFKSKWGTTETRYFYYTKIRDKGILKLDRNELMESYSNYYVYPFNQVDVIQ